MTGVERERRDSRIVRKRSRGASIRDIAKSEGMTPAGTFLALKRLEPQVLTALKRTGYDLYTAITKMVEMSTANEVRLFVIDGQIVEHQVPDNPTRLKARTRLLNLHVGSDIGGAPTEQQASQTSVMVVIGATDERMAALRCGGAPETTTISVSSKRPAENARPAAEGDSITPERNTSQSSGDQ